MVEPSFNPALHHDGLSLSDRELLERLGWFTNLRWLAGGFCLALLFACHHLLSVRFRISEHGVSIVWPVTVVGGLFAYNMAFTLLVRRLRRHGNATRRRIQQLALGQIAFDLLGVCVLVYVTGGVENAFLMLIVLPLVIASELLPPRVAYLAAVGAAALVHALAWGELLGLIPHTSVDWPGARIAQAQLWADPRYVLEMTGAVTILLFATVFLASTIATRLRRREEDLEEAYRQVQQADDTKSFFMRKAGHELRSPLVAVGSILKAILQTVDSLSDDHRRLLDRGQQRVHAAMAILDDLRHYAQLHSLPNLPPSQIVRLGELTRAVADLLRPQAESMGLRLHCAAEDVCVGGDEELLREVISNLLVNAIQYTPAGGQIELSVRNLDSVMQLQVMDTGIGISKEAQDRLFEEFFRAEEAKRIFAEGTGLGLAICKRVVEMHGGRIAASNRPGGGSVFTVELPPSEPAATRPEPQPCAAAVGSA